MAHRTRGATPVQRIRADSLIPVQHRANRSFRIAADVRIQRMLKHPYVSEFHSRAEHLYAGLLEGSPTVSFYVPQPFALRIGKRPYKPDFYVVDDNQRRVLELKPKGRLNPALSGPLEAFFANHGMQFEVVDNESVVARIVEAENWLEIVRALYLNLDLDTEAAETQVLERFDTLSQLSVGDVVDPGDRDKTLEQEIALLRLLHQGRLQANLNEGPLDYDTRVRQS